MLTAKSVDMVAWWVGLMEYKMKQEAKWNQEAKQFGPSMAPSDTQITPN